MIQESHSVIGAIHAIRGRANASKDPEFRAEAATAFNGIMGMITGLVAFSMSRDESATYLAKTVLGGAGIDRSQVESFQLILNKRVKDLDGGRH